MMVVEVMDGCRCYAGEGMSAVQSQVDAACAEPAQVSRLLVRQVAVKVNAADILHGDSLEKKPQGAMDAAWWTKKRLAEEQRKIDADRFGFKDMTGEELAEIGKRISP
tara:strand:+ start:84 stop:407 length:324 start_codon:yes stop_codon:yes gene_type:complete